jgi:hypothetical protein
MTVHFTNPQGRTNKVNIKREDLPKLQALEGYTITKFEATDPFLDEAPAVSKKLTIHSASDIIGCQSCSA